MQKKKVMVLGAGGMAGHVITLELRKQPSFDVIAVSRSINLISPDIILDVTDIKALRNMVLQQKPDIIINCIGTLNEMAENNPANAILINSYLPHYLEDLTKSSTTRLIHISTDCVFSGKRGGYVEADPTDGQGYYAQTKALGEVINNKDITIRTSIIGPELNENGIGLFNWFAKQKGEIKGYTKAYWTGITTTVLVKAIIEIINQPINGLYHLVSPEKISKYSLLQIFMESFQGSKVSSIMAFDNYMTDKSLINTRNDYNLDIPSYQTMVTDMKIWMSEHKELYPHYSTIL